MAAKVCVRQNAGGKFEPARRAMADDVNRLIARAALQRVRDLLQRVPPRIEQHRPDTGPHPVRERRDVRHRGIDEKDFAGDGRFVEDGSAVGAKTSGGAAAQRCPTHPTPSAHRFRAGRLTP